MNIKSRDSSTEQLWSMERGNSSGAEQNVFHKKEYILHLTQAVPGNVNKMAEY
jgi:hypothetical protein